MSILGTGYLGHMSYIRNLVLRVRQGASQEELEVLMEKGGAGCQYDRCGNKRSKTDVRVRMVSHDSNRGVSFCSVSFHSDCLENLLKDPRFPSQN
jgi:hypothetical protein